MNIKQLIQNIITSQKVIKYNITVKKQNSKTYKAVINLYGITTSKYLSIKEKLLETLATLYLVTDINVTFKTYYE